MPKLFMLGLITASVTSVAAGESKLQSQASQSAGDVGGFCLDARDFVKLVKAGLDAGLDFGGQRYKAEQFVQNLEPMLPSDTTRPVAPVRPALAMADGSLKAKRTAKNVTQEQLGDAIGVGRKVIGKWENYGTTDENLTKALNALARF
jgi:DNA-binding XRE family transcriptional regulator